jgi:hypothetical protein
MANVKKKINKGLLIGLSGVARCGKGTFATLLTELAEREGYKVSTFALADVLKAELEPFFNTFGTTAYETDTARKALIRPVLVAYGHEKRVISKGRYLIDKIEPAVKRKLKQGHVVLITDIRFNTSETDEVAWIKSLNGKLIHLERIDVNGNIVGPANEEEARNDPAVKAASDVQVVWPTKSVDELYQYVETAWRGLNK